MIAIVVVAWGSAAAILWWACAGERVHAWVDRQTGRFDIFPDDEPVPFEPAESIYDQQLDDEDFQAWTREMTA